MRCSSSTTANFALAERTLLEALGVLEKANLADAPAALATHGNLAVLYSAGLKRPDKAVAEFKKALVIKPDLKLSQQRATPEITANLDRARAELEGRRSSRGRFAAAAARQRRSAPHRGRGELAVSSRGRDCGGRRRQSQVPQLRRQDPAVLLYYKPNGGEEYRVIAMRKGAASEGVTPWQVTIPGSDTNGTWVPIYFEARSGTGAPLAFSGRPENPSVIRVKGSEQANRVAEEDDEEEGGRATKMKKTVAPPASPSSPSGSEARRRR